MINTPLTRHIYGTGYAGWAVQNLVSIVGYPWLKSPAQGAATSITAAVSPDLESHSGKALDSGTPVSCMISLLVLSTLSWGFWACFCQKIPGQGFATEG